MSRHIHRGDAIKRPDLFRVGLNSVIPGARYGVKFWNRPLASVVANVEGEDLPSLRGRLLTAVKNAGVNAYIDTLPGVGFTVEGDAGEAMGPAVDSSPGCYVETLRQGVATSPMIFQVAIPAGASGGTWFLTFTHDGDSDDTATINHNAAESTVVSAIEASANEVAGPGLSGVSVRLVNPGTTTAARVYEVTMGGTFSGLEFGVSVNGGAILGVATISCTTIQEAAGAATAIQSITIPLLPNSNNGRQQALKLSRDGVTSAEVNCELVVSPSDFQTAVDAALATVLGAGVVETTIDYFSEKLLSSGGAIVIVVRWLSLGAQSPLSCLYYNKQPNSYPSISSPASATVTQVRASGANQSEYILVKAVASSSTGGVSPSNYEVTQGATTATINHSSSTTKSQLVTQWEGIAGSGNIDVIECAGGVKFLSMYLLQFKGSKANLDQAVITFTSANGRAIQVICDGEPLVNEIQQVIITANGGVFQVGLSNSNVYNSWLAYNLSANSFKSALEQLVDDDNVIVTGSGTASDPFLVEYVEDLAAEDQPTLYFITSSLTGGAPTTLTVTQSADTGIRQLDKIIIDANAISGSVTPIVGGIVGKAVAYNGNAAAWESGIENSGVGVAVTGAVGGPFFVEYDAPGIRVLTLEQGLLTVSESTLVTLTQLQEATGPLHYNDPLNWSTGVVPGSDDTLVFMDSSSSIQEGLRQRCTFTADIPTGDFRLGTNVNDCGDFAVGQKVKISTTETFPTATINGVSHTLSESTDYYVIAIDRFRRRMQLSTSRTGIGIELTGAGTGVHTVTVRWAKIEQQRSHTGKIGRSRRKGETWEERPRYLKGEAALVEIGAGESGSGSSLCFFDLGTFPFTFYLWESGIGRQGEQAVQVQCSNTLDDFFPRGGQLGIGTDEVPCVIGDLIGQGSDVTLGLVSLQTIDLTNCVHSFPQGLTVSGSVRIM